MRRSCMRSCGRDGRDGAAEVVARGVGVVALGRAGAEDGQRGGLVLLLALELLVGAVLQRLHGGEGARCSMRIWRGLGGMVKAESSAMEAPTSCGRPTGA